MVPSPFTDDYYMVLEVEQSATHELIVKSYKRLALKLHPDRNANHDATEAFQLVCQFSGAKLILLSIMILSVLKSNIEARTSLRDVERRKQTPSLRSQLPLLYTKMPLSSKHTNITSASCFDSTTRISQRSSADRRASKVEARTRCTMADQEECL